jgi:hypothetical protein
VQLLLGEQEVDDPAAMDVWPWPAEVHKDALIGTAGFLQGVGQNGENIEPALLINHLRQGENSRCQPVLIDVAAPSGSE